MSKPTEAVISNRGYDLQTQAFNRLGENFQDEIESCLTSGTIRQCADMYCDQLTGEEYNEFIDFANMIGRLFGFRDEGPYQEEH